MVPPPPGATRGLGVLAFCCPLAVYASEERLSRIAATSLFLELPSPTVTLAILGSMTSVGVTLFPHGPFPGTPAPEYMDPFGVLAQAGRRALRGGVASLVYAGALRVSEGSWTVAEDRCSVPPAGVASATVEELVKTARAL